MAHGINFDNCACQNSNGRLGFKPSTTRLLANRQVCVRIPRRRLSDCARLTRIKIPRTTGSTASGASLRSVRVERRRATFERVTSTVQSGVIVLFTDDGTLLTFIGWSLVWLCGLALIAGPLAVALRRFLTAEVLSPFTLLREMAGERLLPGRLVPVRCPIRVASVSNCPGPPDQRWRHAGAGLRG